LASDVAHPDLISHRCSEVLNDRPAGMFESVVVPKTTICRWQL